MTLVNLKVKSELGENVLSLHPLLVAVILDVSQEPDTKKDRHPVLWTLYEA